MIERNCLAALLVDLRLDGITHTQLAVLEHTEMGNGRAYLLRVTHGKASICAQQHACIADLSAAFGIERRVIQHDLTFWPGSQYSRDRPIEYHRVAAGHIREPIVSGKMSL